MLGAVGKYKIDPFTLSLYVYDPRESLNRWISDPFSEGVTIRGVVDYASAPFGLARKDSFTAALSSYPGTDFSTLPDLGQFTSTPELRRALINALITRPMWGQNGWAQLPPELQQPSTQQKRGRYYFSYAFEQTLWQSAANPANAWGMFGQVAFSDGNPNPFKWEAMAGFGGASPLPGRSNDKFGIGAFYYSYSKELRQALSPILTLDDEYGLEVFYNFAVTKWFKVTADIQVIAPAVKSQSVAPQTIEKNTPVVFMGLRSQVVF
ncbi:MAG: carbohydrate porin [Beijerinckiaceae bacterium]